jgi:hypothetical protein
LAQLEIAATLKVDKLRLALIGMSGSGKSYWSAKLAQQGFGHFCCDAMIAAKLAPDLIKPDDDGGVDGVSVPAAVCRA